MQDAYLRHQLAENNRAMVASPTWDQGQRGVQKRAVDINVVSALEQLKEQGIDEDMLSGLAKSAGAVLPKDQVPVFRDGKMYGVKFEDPELTRFLRGYDQKRAQHGDEGHRRDHQRSPQFPDALQALCSRCGC
jgi:hypothetical protein